MMAKKIAVTGSLSSGKSTVCRFFKELGAYTVSADEIVHQLMAANTHVGEQIIHLFGHEILVNGSIDRSKVAKLAFSDPLRLQALEELLHPIVRNEIEKKYQCERARFPLFVAEIPLLFETGFDQDYEETIAVIAPEEQCQLRFKELKNRKESTYQARMQRQLNADEKAQRASYVIDNRYSLEALKEAVTELYVHLTKNK